MMTTAHPECFGRMLPDLSRMRANRPVSSPVFTVEYMSRGMGVQGRRVDMDIEGWGRCRQCPQFDSCHALSLARFEVERSLSEVTGG